MVRIVVSMREAHLSPPRLPSPKHRPIVENGTFSTGPFVRNRRDTVWGAPARLHRHKPLVSGGSGGRRAAWNPRRPPAAFGSFPLRERNSCVRRSIFVKDNLV